MRSRTGRRDRGRPAAQASAFDATSGTADAPAATAGARHTARSGSPPATAPSGSRTPPARSSASPATRSLAEPRAEIPVPPDCTTSSRPVLLLRRFRCRPRCVWVAGDARGRGSGGSIPDTGRWPRGSRFVRPGGRRHRRGAVWVTSLLDDTVVRIDPRANRIAGHDSRRARRAQRSRRARAGSGSRTRSTGRSPGSTRDEPGGGDDPRRTACRGRSPSARTASGSPPASAALSPAGAIAIGVLSDCRGMLASVHDTVARRHELPLIERGGKRAGTIDGRRRRASRSAAIRSASSSAAPTPRPAARSRRRGGWSNRIGADVLIGPLGGNQGLALQDFARRRPGVAFVNGSRPRTAPQTGAELLQLPRRTAHVDGRCGHLRLQAARLAQGGHRRASSGRRFQLGAGRRTSSRSSARSAGRSRSGSGFRKQNQDFSGLVAADSGNRGSTASSWRLRPARRAAGARAEAIRATAGQPLPEGRRGHSDPGHCSRARQPCARNRLGRAPRPPRRVSGQPPQGVSRDREELSRRPLRLWVLQRDGGDATGTRPRATAISPDGERRFMAGACSCQAERSDTANDPRREPPGDRTERPVRDADADHRSYDQDDSPASTRTFGGYFTAKDPPPSKTTPACVKRTPPPWAR